MLWAASSRSVIDGLPTTTSGGRPAPRHVTAERREVSDARAFHLLETLAAAVADAILARFAVESVSVRVRKPGIAWAEWTGVTASRRS